MRTGRALTVSRRGGVPAGGVPARGGCLPGGVACQGGCLPGGVPARGGVLARGGGGPCLEGGWGGVGGGYLTRPPPRKFGAGTPPPVDRMTHACENITLAKTSFRPVIRSFTVKGHSKVFGRTCGIWKKRNKKFVCCKNLYNFLGDPVWFWQRKNWGVFSKKIFPVLLGKHMELWKRRN